MGDLLPTFRDNISVPSMSHFTYRATTYSEIGYDDIGLYWTSLIASDFCDTN
jgi:hypothetical protein